MAIEGTWKAEAEDNARLFAASKDLLEVCELFVTIFQDFERWPQGRGYCLSDDARNLFVAARAAIAKAKGEQ